MMTTLELEQLLLSLNGSERERLAKLLNQSLITETTAPYSESGKLTLSDAIAHFRDNMSPEELDPNAEDIWQNIRDRTPVPSEPDW
jgi:hypothetical protein